MRKLAIMDHYVLTWMSTFSWHPVLDINKEMLYAIIANKRQLLNKSRPMNSGVTNSISL